MPRVVTTTTFDKYKVDGNKTVTCVHGHKTTIKHTFEGTTNPWNTREDGVSKSPAEVIADLEAQRDAWITQEEVITASNCSECIRLKKTAIKDQPTITEDIVNELLKSSEVVKELRRKIAVTIDLCGVTVKGLYCVLSSNARSKWAGRLVKCSGSIGYGNSPIQLHVNICRVGNPFDFVDSDYIDPSDLLPVVIQGDKYLLPDGTLKNI